MGNLCPSEVAHGDPQETSAPTNAGGDKDPHIDGPIFVKDATPLKSQTDQASRYREDSNVRGQASEYRESKNVEQSNQQGIQAPTNPSGIDGPNGTPIKSQRDQESENRETKTMKHSEVISFNLLNYFTYLLRIRMSFSPNCNGIFLGRL